MLSYKKKQLENLTLFKVYVFKLELSENQVLSCRGSSIKEMFRKLYNDQSQSSALSER